MKYKVKRKDKEITDDSDMKRILKTTEYVTIAMAKDNTPYLVSLSHGYDEEHHCIYFHCAREGKKMDYLKVNDTIWGQALIDHGFYKKRGCGHIYESVMFKGKFTMVEDKAEKFYAICLIARQLNDDAETLIANNTSNWRKGLGVSKIGRIDIYHMTGKNSSKEYYESHSYTAHKATFTEKERAFQEQERASGLFKPDSI